MKPAAKILIVEDDPALSFSMALQLRHAGHEVHECSLGQECLQRLPEVRPDLLILDVVLPDFDGGTLCRQVKEEARWAGMLVLLVSSQRTTTSHQAEGLEAGADGYLARPVSEREFLARVEGLLRMKRAEDELRRVQASLERQVEERTAELSRSLTALHLEMAARRQAEENRRRLEGAVLEARKQDAIGAFAGGIAHEFNNLLTGILGLIDLARTEHPYPPAVHQKLAAIGDLCARARDLTHRLLCCSRPVELSRQPLRLQSLLEGELKILRATLPATIKIDAVIDPEAPPVSADASQIHQALLNLAATCGRAMDGRGRLTLRLDTAELDEVPHGAEDSLRPGRYVRFSLTDTSGGLNESMRQRLFEPSLITSDGERAMGLGLPIAHAIIRNHDGLVLVESTPGQGTTFQILLPAYEGVVTENAPELPTPPRPARTTKGRILLVDDEEILVQVCCETLERRGYVVEGYLRPAEALDALRARPDGFDLIVTDLSMPDLTGLELALEARRINPVVPMVLVTGDPTAIQPQQLKQAGIRHVLLKPFTPVELGHAVSRGLAASSSPASPAVE